MKSTFVTAVTILLVSCKKIPCDSAVSRTPQTWEFTQDGLLISTHRLPCDISNDFSVLSKEPKCMFPLGSAGSSRSIRLWRCILPDPGANHLPVGGARNWLKNGGGRDVLGLPGWQRKCDT